MPEDLPGQLLLSVYNLIPRSATKKMRNVAVNLSFSRKVPDSGEPKTQKEENQRATG